jgi:uncharacterized protein (TIGR03435 family)
MIRLVPVLFAATAAFAQAQEARPAFEAASIKPNNSASNSSSSNGSKGQVLMSNQTLKRLVERAYGVKPFQVTGPGWMEDLHFDIAAKFPPDTKAEDRMPMLRTLLEDRFKLAVHRESKEMPGYALVVAKGGFKLKPVESASVGSDTSTNGGRVRTLTAKHTSMAQLADLLSRYLSQMVVNNTGLDGVYDFEMRWTNDDQNTDKDADTVPSLFTAVEDALGLRLRAQKVPVEMIVVDHVERVPTEN